MTRPDPEIISTLLHYHTSMSRGSSKSAGGMLAAASPDLRKRLSAAVYPEGELDKTPWSRTPPDDKAQGQFPK